MKKLLSILIGFTILLSTTMVGSVPVSADDAADKNKVLLACKEMMTKLEKTLGQDGESFSFVSVKLEKPYGTSFRKKFENARTEYHNYMKCIFDHATAEILGSAAGDTDGIFSANSPNLAEWMKPDVACLGEEKLTEILKQAGPGELLKPMLETYNKYTEFLRQLYEKVSQYATLDESSRNQFWLIIDKNNFFRQLVANESQNAIVALNTAFISLKELRQAFVMHVRFQCMLKSLETYRRVLENMRSVMWVIPDLIEDASKH